MTEAEKASVARMRMASIPYAQIAAELGMSVNTVKAYCQRHGVKPEQDPQQKPDVATRPDACKLCGRRLLKRAGRKPRFYCSDLCRRNWWRDHGNRAMNRRTFYATTCTGCDRVFQSYGNSKRKYCSHGCYIHTRYGVKNKNDNGPVRAGEELPRGAVSGENDASPRPYRRK